jgi:hypothetical protein
MAKESAFVDIALIAAQQVLNPPLSVRRGASLLYEVVVDNNLEIKVDPRKPVRGDSAFQTDLCVFEQKSDQVAIPRVVIEFKTKITTHDVLTYSAKARKHKQIYPYLRYGIVISEESNVPRRFFVHNEALDFVAALSGVTERDLPRFFSQLISAEVEASECLEGIAFGNRKTHLYRKDVQVGKNGDKDAS